VKATYQLLERGLAEEERHDGVIRGELPRFVPHPAQQHVLDTAGRFNCLAMGRRWGKTMLGTFLLLEPSLNALPVAWVSPTYRMQQETWRDFLYYLAPMVASKNAQEKRIELYSGGIIDLWSLDRIDTMRGRKYWRVCVDEAAIHQRLKEAFNLVIRPTLTDYRGDCWFLSTPRGFGEFYELWSYGQDNEHPDWMSWQMPSSKNPYLPPEEIEAARQSMPSRAFQQEFEAAFLPSLSAGMFRREWFLFAEDMPNEQLEPIQTGRSRISVYIPGREA